MESMRDAMPQSVSAVCVCARAGTRAASPRGTRSFNFSMLHAQIKKGSCRPALNPKPKQGSPASRHRSVSNEAPRVFINKSIVVFCVVCAEAGIDALLLALLTPVDVGIFSNRKLRKFEVTDSKNLTGACS